MKSERFDYDGQTFYVEWDDRTCTVTSLNTAVEVPMWLMRQNCAALERGDSRVYEKISNVWEAGNTPAPDWRDIHGDPVARRAYRTVERYAKRFRNAHLRCAEALFIIANGRSPQGCAGRHPGAKVAAQSTTVQAVKSPVPRGSDSRTPAKGAK